MRDPDDFDRRYRTEGDPWDLAGTPYELERYDRIIDALGTRRYRSAYEPGCAVGVLTARLAERCDHLLAIDLSPTAIGVARRRCAGHPEVDLRVGSMQEATAIELDLVVFSEVGYYVEAEALIEVVDGLVAGLRPSGLLVGCHWLGHSADHILHGDTVHEIIDRHPFLDHLAHHRSPERAGRAGFRMDTWERR